MNGSRVFAGGHLHAYIAPGGPWCTPSKSVEAGFEEIQGLTTANGACKVFPNPTTGCITIELSGRFADHTAEVTITSLMGDQILHYRIDAPGSRECSLDGQPAGIYLLRIVSGESTETVKVIKL